MTAGDYTVLIEQGADFSLQIILKDSSSVVRDITGYTARMKIKSAKGVASSLLELTTENGRIAIVGASGQITLSVLATATAALTFTEAVYDLEIVSGAGVVERIIEGNVLLNREVTT